FRRVGPRAKRAPLGGRVALTAGPTASLADGHANLDRGMAPLPLPPTTAEHRIALTTGSTGRQVELLQRALGRIKVDGIYGPETESAVIGFPRPSAPTADNVVRAPTSAALRTHPQAHAPVGPVDTPPPGGETPAETEAP